MPEVCFYQIIRYEMDVRSFSLRVQYFLSLSCRFITSCRRDARKATESLRDGEVFTGVNRDVTLGNAEKFGGQRGCFAVA